MAFASLLDAGADLDEVQRGLRVLPLTGWRLSAARAKRGGLTATQLTVELGEDATERTWASLRGTVEGASELPARARRRALATFEALAKAEGRVHGLLPEDVHFHEAGGADAILDVVGTCLALESLKVDTVYASPVALGAGGVVESGHGVLPNPAPAVLELLKGAPVYGTAVAAELVTPTGAALLTALASHFGPMPAFSVTSTGYGAGSRDTPGRPNVVQAVIGELEAPPLLADGRQQRLAVLEANLDDVTGEVLAHSLGALVEAGALDAWVAPVIGKKGRPAHVLSALAEFADLPALAEILLRETGTLGFRQQAVERFALPRSSLLVDVAGQTVRVKLGPNRAKAEHEDCVRAAGALGLPVREVARRAEAVAASKLAFMD
jgi:uncharacterized protein (TIGR00299 family) protein